MAGVDPRKLLGEVLEFVVYAPVGLAATVIEELPALVEKGKTRVTTARTIGQFVVVMGRQRVEKAVADRRGAGRAADVPSEAAEPQPAPDAADKHVSAETVETGDEAAPGSATAAPRADGLAIPGYDSLAASQVVQRLAGLSVTELEAVRDYEEATRGRRTILGRIAQLTSSRGEPGSG